MLTKSLFVPVLFAAMMFGLGGCGFNRSVKVAQQAVEQFHKQLDQGDTKGIAASADAKYKTAATGTDFTAMLDRIHQKLGPVRSTSKEKTDYNYNNGITDVVLGYKTRFAAGDATETFTYQIDGDKAVLRDYKIDSPEVNQK